MPVPCLDATVAKRECPFVMPCLHKARRALSKHTSSIHRAGLTTAY